MGWKKHSADSINTASRQFGLGIKAYISEPRDNIGTDTLWEGKIFINMRPVLSLCAETERAIKMKVTQELREMANGILHELGEP